MYVLQNYLAFKKFGKPSSFHTYAAKIAAVSQGVFLIFFFILPDPVDLLFYVTAWLTLLDLAEEIALIKLVPEWRTDLKGIYWVMKKK